MQKYKSSITSTTGAAIRNVPVQVLKIDGTLAELFKDRAGSIAAENPLKTASDGTFYFYAVNGRYSLRTTVDGITITDEDVVLMNDPEEISTAGPIADAVRAAEAAAERAELAVMDSGIPELVGAAQNAVVDANAALEQAQQAASQAADAKSQALAAQSLADAAKAQAEQSEAGASAAKVAAEAARDLAAGYAASIDPAALDARLDAAEGRVATLEGRQKSIGDGQAWQDMKASRAIDVTYTNTTGRSILVQVWCNNGVSSINGVTLLVAGRSVSHHANATSGMGYTVSGVVPSEAAYKVIGTNLSIREWSELR